MMAESEEDDVEIKEEEGVGVSEEGGRDSFALDPALC